MLSAEVGGHRFIRVPPTEKKGRTQTSIVTVSVTDTHISSYKLNKAECTKQYIRAQGNGGQKVNKTSSCVLLTHVPSGLQVKVQDTRDQRKNEQIAWERLEQRLGYSFIGKQQKNIDAIRFSQVGDSSRSDRRRTYRIEQDIVIDHLTGKEARVKDVLKGNIGLLH